jgi:putative transposase
MPVWGLPFPDAVWQRCVVHWYRNMFSHVPATKVREIATMLKAIHASEDIVAAREKAVRVIEKLRTLRLSNAAELVESAVEETLTYYAFPEEHWRRIRTNNPGVAQPKIMCEKLWTLPNAMTWGMFRTIE